MRGWDKTLQPHWVFVAQTDDPCHIFFRILPFHQCVITGFSDQYSKPLKVAISFPALQQPLKHLQ